ncbi:MAG: WD40 repeat domain-containing protein [Planctomycetaceae bacterium]
MIVLTLCVSALIATAGAADPPVTAIAFAPDGQSVIVGSQAGLVVHGWPDLKPERSLDTKLINIHALAFAPGGMSLAAAGGTPSEQGQVEIFDWPDGNLTVRCTDHEDSVLGIAWSNDSLLATASLDHVVTLWKAESGESVQQLKGHSRGVSSVCFLPDTDMLVSAGLDQNLRVWEIATQKLLRTLNNHTLPVHQIALRPGGVGLPMVASVSDDRTVRLWQPTIGRMVRFAQLDSTPLAVDWLTDGSYVVVTSADGHVRLIDPDTVEVVQDLPAVTGWAYSLGIHPMDGSLLIGGREGQLRRVIPDGAAP